MIFNTSGMIRNLRTDGGRLCWAPGEGAGPYLPAGVPAQLGGLGGTAALTSRQVEAGSWSFQNGTAAGPWKGVRGLEGQHTWPGGQGGQGAEGTGPTRGQGGQVAGRVAHSHCRCSHHSAGCSGHPRHCCYQHCPARRGQTPCPLHPLLGRRERG